jgi:transglutaminase-like putative cysteine protease
VSRARASLAADIGATLAVAAFSLAVAAGFARVFSGWDFLTDLALLVAVGHGTGLVLRRLPLSGWIAVPLTTVALVWALVVLYFPETLSWGLPTSVTWDVFGLEMDSVREQFGAAVAPVIHDGGWDVLAGIGMAVAVAMADVFAFRADARAETLVPGGVLFVFVGALGDDRLRVALTVVLVAVGVVTTVALRAYHSRASGRASTVVSLRRIWPATIAVALAVAVAAGVVGPRLPGADAAPLYDTKGRGGGVTEVVSPLVDIRSRLTNRSTDEMFRVRAGAASYWRSSALPEFDGTTWRLPERTLAPVGGELSAPRPGAVELRQRIEIVDLRGSLVPAAPDPFQASGRDDLRWVAETSTLVTVDGDLRLGDVVEVVSGSPRFEAATLSAATADGPGDPIYTELPADFPSVVRETARLVAGDAGTPYEAAMALQTWFQTSFEYSLEVQAGHSSGAIVAFLRNGVGYCEQFAGTFAAMMRTLGHPARVAVGFTSGVEVAPGTFSVEGRHAHAWPEVWFDGLGWVGFEPTPGRGAPGAESYTGLPARQDTTGDAATVDAAADDEVVPTTTVPLGTPDQPLDPNLPEEFADPTGAGDTPEVPAEDAADRRWMVWLLMVLTAVGLVAAAPAVARRVRHRGGAASTERELGRLWRHSVESLDDVGVPITPSMTPIETAAATARTFPVAARPVALLADAVTTATYRPEGAAGFDDVGEYGLSTMRNCRNWTRQIDRAVHDHVAWHERLRRHFTDWG